MGCTNDKSKQIENEIESILEANIISNQPSESKTKQEGKLKDFFRVEGAIGKGAYGRVYKIISLVNGAEYVVKMVKKDQEREQQIAEKIRIIENLDHPNIAKISNVYNDSRFYYLVQDYCTGGELLDKLLLFNYLNEDIAANIMHQILSALVQLHSKSLIHRDLCLRSLFLELNDVNSAIKIVDFAYSIFLNQKERMKQSDFQPYFMAPEVATGNFDESSDVWSCGVILFFLLSGKPPFQGDDFATILRQTQKGEYNFNEPV